MKKLLERRVLEAAMRMTRPWVRGGIVRDIRGNRGTLAVLIRACDRLAKARAK